jgi:hypothetical protein
MLRLNITQLPLREQKLYKLILVAIGSTFTLGLLWVLLGFSDQTPAADNEWQQTSVAAGSDPFAQFVILNERPRWFIEAGTLALVLPPVDPLKALEGKPESMRLTGLVTKGDKTYALFISLIASAGASGKPAIRQLAEGDTLVGEWVVKNIGHSQVEIQQGDETQILKMYQPKAK